jgi:carboxynorspermidine decarboxylase
MFDINISNLQTPCYLLDERVLIKNLQTLENIQKKTGCKILLAQKAFSMFSVYPTIAKYLSGTTASGLYEAKLGYEEMGKPFNKETHIFAPAYLENEIDEILEICDHVVFNSFSQLNKYREKISSLDKKIEIGMRINPEYSEIDTDIYNPCAPCSRLGATLSQFEKYADSIEGLDGLHFHTMCEQNSDTLERTIQIIDDEFGKYISKMKWINFGGGHHITKPGYDIEKLIKCIMFFKNKYGVEVYIEPGEAIALNAGYLVASVLDTMENGMRIAILDASASCHMPDVLEMPYRPNVINSTPNGKARYRLTGNTCLAGDVIGDYSFDSRLKVGDKVVFCDMAIYTMVKNNTFNGMKLPSIAIYRENSEIEIIKSFDYQDFKNRLS